MATFEKDQKSYCFRKDVFPWFDLVFLWPQSCIYEEIRLSVFLSIKQLVMMFLDSGWRHLLELNVCCYCIYFLCVVLNSAEQNRWKIAVFRTHAHEYQTMQTEKRKLVCHVTKQKADEVWSFQMQRSQVSCKFRSSILFYICYYFMLHFNFMN